MRRAALLVLAVGLACQAQVMRFPQWRHLSSANGDLPPPFPGTQQTGSAVGDLDKDGADNFILTDRTKAPSVVWFRREGSGWRRYIIDNEPLRIEAGGTCFDVDGDGDLDYVVGADSRGNQVWWWENPYPTFDPEKPWPRRLIKDSGANKHHDLIFADFKGTGRAQLVFWNQGARKLFLAEIPRDPRSAEPWPFGEIYSWEGKEHEGIAAADIDGDGKLDIVGGGRWFKHDGGDVFRPIVIDDSQRFTRAAAGQLVRGGRPEVVFVPGDENGRLKWYEARGDPARSESWIAHDLLGAEVRRGHGLQIGDINGDGNLDIFNGEQAKWTHPSPLADNPEAKARVFYGDGKGNFVLREVVTGLCFHEAKLADVDGDGDLDIVNKPYTLGAPRIDLWINTPGDNAPAAWWDRAFPYRIPIEVNAAGYSRFDKPVELGLNAPGIESGSARLVECNAAGQVVDADVPFQLDPDGTLTFVAKGAANAEATRFFHLYYGAASASAKLPPQVTVEDDVPYQGQASIRITTPVATYIYHKQGGGFAAILDRDGNDWIGYRPGGRAAGEFRGIPNLGVCFHPGYTNSTSRLLSRGPVRARIHSETNDRQWAATWDVYPQYATMTLDRAGGSYWFLYEGTPGGKLDADRDFLVLSTGESRPVSESWAHDLPAPEWVYFGDPDLRRVLFVAKHEDDEAPDQFWQMNGEMTVFGFGRQYRCCEKYLTAAPARFTIGLVEERAFSAVSGVIESAWRGLKVRQASRESLQPSP